MASLMEDLIDVLEQEQKEYEVLLDLSMKKTPVIVSADLEQLQKISSVRLMERTMNGPTCTVVLQTKQTKRALRSLQ